MHATMGRARPVGLLALAAFFLLSAAWAVALPVNGTYDENQHVVRAYAVVTGQWLPSGQAVDAAGLPAEAFDGPRSLLPENADCTWLPKPPKPASCQREVTDRTHTMMPSQAARYSPVYYLLVGLPLRVSPDSAGVVGARLLSALLSAALLGAAAAIATRVGRAGAGRLLFAGLVLVATPLAVNLAGSVNPNGLEITAGVLLFVALTALLRTRQGVDRPTARWLLAAAGTAGALLLTVRQIGPVLFVGVVLACLLTARRGRVRGLLTDRHAQLLAMAPAVAAGVFTAFWMVWSPGGDVDEGGPRGHAYGLVGTLRRLPGERLRFYVDQIVARFSYGETTTSPALVLAWYGLVALLVLPALWYARRRLRLVVAGVTLACAGILVAGEVHFMRSFGWYSHSRYIMPLGVGVVLLAAPSDRLAAALRARGRLAAAVTALVAATVPLHLYALIRVMTRFQVGITASFDPFGGSWQPPLGPTPALLAAVAGATLLVVVAARTSWWGGADTEAAASAQPPARPWQTEDAGHRGPQRGQRDRPRTRPAPGSALPERVTARKDELG